MRSPEEFIQSVAEFSRTDTRVVAAAVCGSYARGTARPDSDIDFALVTPNPDTLSVEHDWLDTFGIPKVVGIEDYRLVQSIRAYYGVLEIEFGICGLEWLNPPIDSGTAEVICQPLRVLYDPDRMFDRAIADAKSRNE